MMLNTAIQLLSAAAKHAPSEVAPCAILWADPKGEWKPLLSLLRERLPQLLTYGEYDLDERCGPSIWLKCVVERTLSDIQIPDELTPIIYLPEVSRQSLRAGNDCPAELQPLVELLYRGTTWTQKSGRDWTVEAMLVSGDAMGLDLARDNVTRLSMMASLSVLATTPVERLQGKRLEAEDFNKLMIGDHPHDLLRWMSSPETCTEELKESGKWVSFASECNNDYKFDPESDGAIVAGERLGLKDNTAWEQLWERFRLAPVNYPGIPDLLSRSKPSGVIAYDKETWPTVNANEEDRLREALGKLEDQEPSSVRETISKLDQDHGERRNWVWAKLGQAPLAGALEELVKVAERTSSHLGGDSADEMARLYAESGFLVDDAAIRVLASVKSAADRTALFGALRSIYLPWVDQSAKRLQGFAKTKRLPVNSDQETIAAELGQVLLFADGLRYDVAQRLVDALSERNFRCTQKNRWAALPSVTATAKPAVSPIAEQLVGVGLPNSFVPKIKAEGQDVTFARLQKLLKDSGYQIIDNSELGDPAAKAAKGWCEAGQIDKRGHDLQVDLAGIIEEQVEGLADRIADLIGAGWRSVRVITDHGWLLMPGNLPKTDLPHYLASSRWSRCATIKGGSQVSVPKAVWHWNTDEEFALAPGVDCFAKGNAYAHGGVSLQECLIADMTVEPANTTTEKVVEIKEVKWANLKCRVAVDPADPTWTVDIRTKPSASDSSVVTSAKDMDTSGAVTLFVEDGDLLESVAVVVVCDASGTVITKQNTTIGGS